MTLKSFYMCAKGLIEVRGRDRCVARISFPCHMCMGPFDYIDNILEILYGSKKKLAAFVYYRVQSLIKSQRYEIERP